MEIYNKVREEIVRNKELKESGKDIIIPYPFPRFAQNVPGIMKGTYTIISGNQKSGKSQIADYMYLYNALNFVQTKNTNIDVFIPYFTLEMSKEAKIRQAIVHRLFLKHRKILTTRQLRSLFDGYTLPQEIISLIDADKTYFEYFEDKVKLIDGIKNPTGIYKYLRDYFHANGRYIDKQGHPISYHDIEKNDLQINLNISHYEPNNPDLFVIPVIDHISLLNPEKQDGKMQTTYDAIAKLSSDYLIKVRNRWQASICVVQQQTLAKESNESAKMDRHEPSSDGLSDYKGSAKDCDQLITIYSPFRNKVRNYLGYDITRMQNYYRRLAVELDREGATFETSLYFNGKVNFFKELPQSSQITNEIYNKITNEQVYS